MGFTVINDDDFQDLKQRKRQYDPKKMKKSRVNDLFAQFEKLSQVEKINFINLIKNYG